MIRVTEQAITSLMATYAKYFIEDFTVQVMDNLKGSCPIENELLRTFANEEMAQILEGDNRFAMEEANVATRFLHECASFVLDQRMDNAESRAVYDQVKDLPSVHHDELRQTAFSAADFYQKTLDVTVIGVLAKEAEEVAQTIDLQVKERLSNTQSGGHVKQFSWGILSDGLWLNNALSRAYEMARIFHPSEPVRASYGATGFDFAATRAPIPLEMSNNRDECAAGFELVASHVNLPAVSGDYSIKEMTLDSHAMHFAIDKYRPGLRNPRVALTAVRELSDYAQQLPTYIEAAKTLAKDDLINQAVVDRLDQVNDAVCLMLVGFEAVRETDFAQSLILYVDGEGDDPTVNVFVNGDNSNAAQAAGIADTDLVKFGNHLDPRKGIYTPPNGWDLQWVAQRKDDIVAQETANEAKRLETMRDNDAAVIRELTKTNLTQIATSYADACNRGNLTQQERDQISDIARRISHRDENAEFSLSGETVSLLCSVIGNDIVSATADRFMSYASSQDEQIRTNARALAVAASAIHDAGTFFTVSSAGARG